jgi:hypothetical protein
MSKWEIEVLYDNGVKEQFEVETTEQEMDKVVEIVTEVMNEGGNGFVAVPRVEGTHTLSLSKITRFSVKEVEK